ncbi:16037_t:CDS:1, partial [Acaulospora morrowiae]
VFVREFSDRNPANSHVILIGWENDGFNMMSQDEVNTNARAIKRSVRETSKV